MDRTRLQAILENHVPAAAVPYCIQLWDQHPFDFKLRKNRVSKVGDFSCRPGKTPRITVNSESHPYLFLMTYVHEVAHLLVHKAHGWKHEAHGAEWKKTFQILMSPVMKPGIYPATLLRVIEGHMADPKASSFSDSILTQAFRDHDTNFKHITLLSQLPEGSIFGLHGRWFKKGELKRTRVVCRELKSKRNYLVAADAPVEGAQLSLL
jgi:SprT protein